MLLLGLIVCRDVRAVDSTIKGLILTSYEDDEALFAAIMAGASGYVLKQIRGTDLVGAVRTVASGQSLLDPRTTAQELARMRAAIAAEGEVDARTGAICSLVAATDLDRKVLGDLDRKQVKARLKDIGEGQWAAAAVKKAIEDIQAAVMVAIVASTTAATAGSGS